LSITVTVHGLVPVGQALLRSGARIGDEVWVTGTLGDAAGGLRQWQARKLQSAKLRYRLDRPTPRIAAALALRNLAHSAIDISDGLAADLGHVLESSGVGAEIDLGRLPTSTTLLDHFATESERWQLQLAGGDDYELCFTASTADALAIEQAMAECDTTVTAIGRITAGRDAIFQTPDGEAYSLPSAGYQHFVQGNA
jgi:thiamine-monophosphate kinase